MKKSTKYIIEKNYVTDLEYSEIDFDLRDELGIDEDDDETLEICNNKFANWAGESHPIKITRLITALTEMQVKSCEYVEIMYHTDHIGYVLTGLNISKFDENTIRYKSLLKKYQKNQDEYKKERIKELEQELNRLKK